MEFCTNQDENRHLKLKVQMILRSVRCLLPHFLSLVSDNLLVLFVKEELILEIRFKQMSCDVKTKEIFHTFLKSCGCSGCCQVCLLIISGNWIFFFFSPPCLL